MNKTAKIVIGTLLAVIAYDAYAWSINDKTIKRQNKAIGQLDELQKYLSWVLDREDVPLTYQDRSILKKINQN